MVRQSSSLAGRHIARRLTLRALEHLLKLYDDEEAAESLEAKDNVVQAVATLLKLI